MVIDLISPDNETSNAQSQPVEDEQSMEVVDNQSDVDSSPWTSCESSPPQCGSDFNEATGLNDILDQVADMSEVYHLDEYSSQQQIVEPFFQTNSIDRFNVNENSLGGLYGDARLYREESVHIETGFPGPMDEYYEEFRREALKIRPL